LKFSRGEYVEYGIPECDALWCGRYQQLHRF